MKTVVVVALLLAGCAAAPSPQSATVAPLAPPDRAAKFVATYQARGGACIDRYLEKRPGDPFAAFKWCTCQIDVFASSFTEPEMDAFDHVTFKQNDNTREGVLALAAASRVQPMIAQRCGISGADLFLASPAR
jgi:hypothetical protein